MSYVDEVIDLVVKKNPHEPEFHQAVKEVLESLRVVIEANEEKYRKEALLERLKRSRNDRFSSVYRGWTTMGRYTSTRHTAYSSTVRLDHTREVSDFIHPST